MKHKFYFGEKMFYLQNIEYLKDLDKANFIEDILSYDYFNNYEIIIKGHTRVCYKIKNTIIKTGNKIANKNEFNFYFRINDDLKKYFCKIYAISSDFNILYCEYIYGNLIKINNFHDFEKHMSNHNHEIFKIFHDYGLKEIIKFNDNIYFIDFPGLILINPNIYKNFQLLSNNE